MGLFGNKSKSGNEEGSDFVMVNGAVQKYKGKDPFINIPEGVQTVDSIGTSAWLKLTGMTIPSSLQYPGFKGELLDSFNTCFKMTTIRIGSNDTREDVLLNLLSHCVLVKNIELADNVTIYSFTDGVLFSSYGKRLVRALRLKGDEYTVPDGVTCIGSDAFGNHFNPQNLYIKKLSIPTSVTDIEEFAFHDSIGLEEMIIPDSVKTIGSGVFFKCDNLKSVKLSDSITKLPSGLFADCGQLRYVNIPANTAVIEDAVFSSCVNLTDVVLPETLTEIGASAFMDCKSLKQLVIPASVTKIGDSAFAGTTSAVIRVKQGSYAEKFVIEERMSNVEFI